MANMHKKISLTLVFTEMQIKTIMSYHVLTRITKKITDNTNFCQRCGANGTLIYCWWVYKIAQISHCQHN